MKTHGAEEVQLYVLFLSERSSVRISAGTPTILTEILSGFPQFLQENIGMVFRLGNDHFPQKPFPIHHLSTILPFDAKQCSFSQHRKQPAQEKDAPHKDEAHIKVRNVLSDTSALITVVFLKIKSPKL
jgi:hypothetical protein